MFSEIRYGAAGVADEDRNTGWKSRPANDPGALEPPLDSNGASREKSAGLTKCVLDASRPTGVQRSKEATSQSQNEIRTAGPTCVGPAAHLHPQRCRFLDADEGVLRECGLIILRNRDAARYALVLDVAAGVVLDGEVAFDTLHDNVSAAVF